MPPAELPNSSTVLVTRTGEGVAEKLRNMILRGDLKDGDMLPPQRDLLDRFHVSHPSLREGLRILEAEGLIGIRRGRHGGAVVQVPRASGVAYHLGLVLQAEKVHLADVAMALQEFEPICFGFAAANPESSSVLVPKLIEASNRLEENIDADGETYTNISREFHTLVVRHSGNSTTQVIIGALGRLWTMQEDNEAREKGYNFHPTVAERLEVLALHRRLIDLIDRQEVAASVELARRHYAENGRYEYWRDDQGVVDVTSLAFTRRNAD